MKMLSVLFFLLLPPMAFNFQLPSPGGSAAASQFLKAVSATLIPRSNLWTFQKTKSDSIFGIKKKKKKKNPPIYVNMLVPFFFCAAQHLLRTDPVEDGEGFFIALFTKNNTVNYPEKQATCKNTPRALRTNRLQNVKKKFVISCTRTKLFQTWLHAKQSRRRRPKTFFEAYDLNESQSTE
jgi:hypothetical protein